MDGKILTVTKLDLCQNYKVNHDFENIKPLILPETPEDSRNNENLYNNSSSLIQCAEKDDSVGALCLSEEDSSLFKTQDISPLYVRLPSISKLKKIKHLLSEVNAKYLDWMISELVLSKYKIVSSDMPPHTLKKIEDIISFSIVLPFKTMKNRRGDNLNILGIEEDDFIILSKRSLLSSEKKEFTNKMMVLLNSSILKLQEDKQKIKGMFGSHCLKVVPADTAVSEERVQQAQMNDHMKLRFDQGCELLISSNQKMLQLTELEVNTVKKLQKTSYSSLKEKTRCLCNNMCILKHKLDEITLADENQTRSINEAGQSLRISVDSLVEKRKSLLKTLEKYERKEKTSKAFSETVAEYAKTMRQLHHKQQTLKVLNEPDESFS